MKFNKIAITELIAISLLFLVSVTSVFLLNNWSQTHFSSLTSKFEDKKLENYIQITKFERNENSSLISIQNLDSQYYIIDQIKVNKEICEIEASNVILANTSSYFNIGCNYSVGSALNVNLILKEGIYEQNLLNR